MLILKIKSKFGKGELIYNVKILFSHSKIHILIISDCSSMKIAKEISSQKLRIIFKLFISILSFCRCLFAGASWIVICTLLIAIECIRGKSGVARTFNYTEIIWNSLVSSTPYYFHISGWRDQRFFLPFHIKIDLLLLTSNKMKLSLKININS